MQLFRISSQELVNFTKNLSVMLKSGITINEALGELAEQSDSGSFRKILTRVQKDIEGGLSLSEAFSKEKYAFGTIFLSIIKAGEASGTLEENLIFLADWLEHNNDIKREVTGAMMYPMIVFTATIGLGAVLSMVILPRLLPLFSQFNQELPLPTRALLAVTKFLQSYWYIALIGIAVAIVVFIVLSRIRVTQRVFHHFYIRIPVIGKLLREYQIALLAQLFATLFRGGLSIYEILDIASEGATNVAYQDAIRTMGTQVTQGTTLADAMKHYPKLFPRNFINIVAVGERSGTLDESFVYMTDYYTKEVKAKTKRLPNIIEPVLLLFMGGMVAFVAISIILPIYQFTSSVGR